MDQLPFIPDQLYNRRLDIHKNYGGNWQSGICPSSTFPYIFIFSGTQGKQHGYRDGWDNPNVFSYTGEGQAGDMQFTKGNLALRDHKKNGKRVFLFEAVGKGFVKFKSELEFYDADYFETHDTSKLTRTAIRFFFKRKGAYVPSSPTLFEAPSTVSDLPPNLYEVNIPNVTERIGLVTSRVGQGAYRKSIIHRWEYKCAVTGFNKPEILIASHIHPWKDSNDDERLDVNNGILLSPVYDALFDKHLITFDNKGIIKLSSSIENEAFQKIGVSGKEMIKNFNSDNHLYMEKHRTLFR